MSKVAGTIDFRLLIIASVCAFVLVVLLGDGAAKTKNAEMAEKKTCTLNMTDGLTVKRFNGEDVYWTALQAEKIPEGSHSLTLNFYNELPGEDAVALEDIVVTYDHFKAGHAYLLTVRFEDPASPAVMTGVGIKDITNEPDWAAQLQTADWDEGFEWLPATRPEAADRAEESE